jgi:hypothetical protein
MSADPQRALPTIDPTVLSAVVGSALGDPTLELLDWGIEPVDHEKIIETTGGLFLLRGAARGTQGSQPWSVVLKILNNPKEWAQNPHDWSYWKRELLAYGSGLLAALLSSIRAPRCYGTSEGPDQGLIWMEYVVEAGERRWSVEQFERAARHAGRLAGAFLTGTPLPEAPWLSRPFLRSAFAADGFWAPYMDPANPEGVWQSPLVQGAFDPALRAEVLRIWADKERFLTVIDRLPQVLCHNDFHRRNLIWRVGEQGQEELVAVDWSFSGLDALGMDLGGLVALSRFLFEIELAAAGELEASVLKGYLAGLQEAGWRGDPRLARLGYLLSTTLRLSTLPGWAALMLPPEAGVNVQAMYGRPADSVLQSWVRLTELMVEQGEETRSLIAELGLG